MFEVELLRFVDHKAADEYEALTGEERDKMGVMELIDVANSLREVAPLSQISPQPPIPHTHTE